jgi:hypothetical protein
MSLSKHGLFIPFWHNPCLQAYIVAAVDENWLIELLKERLKEMRETSDLGLSA